MTESTASRIFGGADERGRRQARNATDARQLNPGSERRNLTRDNRLFDHLRVQNHRYAVTQGFVDAAHPAVSEENVAMLRTSSCGTNLRTMKLAGISPSNSMSMALPTAMVTA
jgi:hypothetical protein